MAQANKRRPWLLEVQPPGTTGWYPLDAFRDEDEVKAQADLVRKRVPAAGVRYRDTRKPSLD